MNALQLHFLSNGPSRFGWQTIVKFTEFCSKFPLTNIHNDTIVKFTELCSKFPLTNMNNDTIVKFTELCSKFPPTALLNFACDWLALDRDITSHVGAIVNRPNDTSLSRANQSQAKFMSAVGRNLLQSWVNLTIVKNAS